MSASMRRLQSCSSPRCLPALNALAGVVEEGDRLWIGAMTRHRDVEERAGAIAGLAAMAPMIGDPQVHARGTLH